MLINLLLLKDFITFLNVKRILFYFLLKLKSLDNWGSQLEKIPYITTVHMRSTLIEDIHQRT